MGWLPKFIKVKCPVGVALHDSDGNTIAFASQENTSQGSLMPQSTEPTASFQSMPDPDCSLMAWITEEGEKIFFIPYGGEASYANMVANGSGTMKFSAAIIDVSTNEPLQIKAYEDVALTAGKEFLVDLTENSQNIAVADLQLLLVENGEVVGEVEQDGTEIIGSVA